jgi:hypothetical protein
MYTVTCKFMPEARMAAAVVVAAAAARGRRSFRVTSHSCVNRLESDSDPMIQFINTSSH